MDRTVEELNFGKDHGAVGVLLKGLEHGFFLDNPCFYPMYERAQDLDLPICVHVGGSLRRMENLPIGRIIPTQAAMMDHLAPVLKAFWTVLTSDLHDRFPRLRWAFLECGSSWVPLIFQQQQRLASTSQGDAYRGTGADTTVYVTKMHAAEIMAEKRMYVACESDEDLPYLINFIGSSQILCGTDYCHNDIGADPKAHSTILGRQDIDKADARRIVEASGRELFGITVTHHP
jgi:predicted TIM-barrel fold metal-dependent hydrolase